jgi:hypothetical integral membrane protein (TIGR02206 family)
MPALVHAAHLSALGLTVLVSVALVGLTRRSATGARVVRALLAGALLALVLTEVGMAVRGGWFAWQDFLPLHLCDAAIVLALIGLTTLKHWASELLYFWAGTGTLGAMITPDLSQGFPSWEFVLFFGLHGLVLASALVLTFGLRLSPRPGAPRRVFLVTNAYAAVVGIVNLACNTNYLYLRARPEAPTLLDHLGAWPLYLVVCEGVAWLAFQLLGLPWRRMVAPAADR